MLGAKPSRKNEIDLLIRQEIANTEGVLQILKYKTLYATGTRLYDAYCSILLQSRRTIDISFGVTMQSGGSGMPVIPASFIRFESGKTLQDLYDSGELQGPQGKEGDPGLDGMAEKAVFDFTIPKGSDGVAATVEVDSTVTGAPGTNAAVVNVGTTSKAKLKFTVPQGADGTPGTNANVNVVAGDSNIVVTSSGTTTKTYTIKTDGGLVK
jgi:hypothetical protein